MTVYVGLIVLDTIKNKLRYDQNMKEILHFIKTHK